MDEIFKLLVMFWQIISMNIVALCSMVYLAADKRMQIERYRWIVLLFQEKPLTPTVSSIFSQHTHFYFFSYPFENILHNAICSRCIKYIYMYISNSCIYMQCKMIELLRLRRNNSKKSSECRTPDAGHSTSIAILPRVFANANRIFAFFSFFCT